MSALERAIALAATAHAGQWDKAGGHRRCCRPDKGGPEWH